MMKKEKKNNQSFTQFYKDSVREVNNRIHLKILNRVRVHSFLQPEIKYKPEITNSFRKEILSKSRDKIIVIEKNIEQSSKFLDELKKLPSFNSPKQLIFKNSCFFDKSRYQIKANHDKELSKSYKLNETKKSFHLHNNQSILERSYQVEQNRTNSIKKKFRYLKAHPEKKHISSISCVNNSNELNEYKIEKDCHIDFDPLTNKEVYVKVRLLPENFKAEYRKIKPITIKKNRIDLSELVNETNKDVKFNKKEKNIFKKLERVSFPVEIEN